MHAGLVSGGRDGMVRLYDKSNLGVRTEFDIRHSLGGVYASGSGSSSDAAAVCTV
jgi:hypothetical protein